MGSSLDCTTIGGGGLPADGSGVVDSFYGRVSRVVKLESGNCAGIPRGKARMPIPVCSIVEEPVGVVGSGDKDFCG
jgi:hypothetical protein